MEVIIRYINTTHTDNEHKQDT